MTYLITRHDGNLLRGPVASGADVDQVDAELLQLARQQDGLLDAPLQPLAVRALFRARRPVRRAEPHEERSFVRPRGADGLDDAQREARAVLEGLAAVAVRARVCERGEEGVQEVAVRSVDLYKVDCGALLVSPRMTPLFDAR